MKNFVLMIGVLVSALFCLMGCEKKEEDYRQIQIYKIEGKALVTRQGTSMEVYENMLLQSGDTLATDSETYLQLKLDEDKYILMEPHTEISLYATGNSIDSNTGISLVKGAIVNQLDNPLSEESTYQVTTPNSTMAVRGTTFRVEITYHKRGESFAKIAVYGGKVECKLIFPDGTIKEPEVVESGEEVLVRGDKKESEYVRTGQTSYDELKKQVLEFLNQLIEKGEELSISKEEVEDLKERIQSLEENNLEIEIVEEDKQEEEKKTENKEEKEKTEKKEKQENTKNTSSSNTQPMQTENNEKIEKENKKEEQVAGEDKENPENISQGNNQNNFSNSTEGSTNQSSSNEGSSTEGDGNQNSSNEGSSTEGDGNQNSGNEGGSTEGDGNQNSGNEGSSTEGSGDQSSNAGGNGTQDNTQQEPTETTIEVVVEFYADGKLFAKKILQNSVESEVLALGQLPILKPSANGVWMYNQTEVVDNNILTVTKGTKAVRIEWK